MPIDLIVITISCIISHIDFPLEFNGRVFLGKYLNSDTARFNMDASAQMRCTMIRYKNLSYYMEYRDDLDMAEQKGGVSLDPRYSHYYVTGGFEYKFSKSFCQVSFVHDCVHDIDYEVTGTPVFNRLSLLFANSAYHPANIIITNEKFLWAFSTKFYPHWEYHGWDINAGADYQLDFNIDLTFKFYDKKSFAAFTNLYLLVCKSDTTVYHQDFVRMNVFYKNFSRRFGVELKYNFYNNDPIKDPGGLWLLSVFVEF